MPKLQFPENFIWGTATSAHQVEGGNFNDWSEWEKKRAQKLASEAPKKYAELVPHWEKIKDQATNPENYISGKAADHYLRFQEDLEIMKSLNIKAYRFSLEWSRLEPRRNEFSDEAINHYREVIRLLKENNIEPFITLWHRTNPIWIAAQGDWRNSQTVEDYLNYVTRVMEVFGQEVKYWMPLNEPIMSTAGGYLGGVYPPEVKNPFMAFRVLNHFVSAHNGAYKIIKRLNPQAVVGMPHAGVVIEPYENIFPNRVIAKIVEYFGNWKILNAVKDYVDFIGVQYYTKGVIDLTTNKYFLPVVEQVDTGTPKTDMGWEIHPEGLHEFIKKVWQRYYKPIIVTENGLADAEDNLRAMYIKKHLAFLHRAIEEGIDIKGYFYWSLLDNLEWDKGFWPRFGLMEVDYKTMARKVRPSAKVYAEIIQNNGLEVE